MMARTLTLASIAAVMTTIACAQEPPAPPPPYVPPEFASSGNPAFDMWRRDFAARAVNTSGKDRAVVESVLAGLVPNPEVGRLNESQPEFVRPIWTYIAGAVSQARIVEGRTRLAEQAAAVRPVAERLGVPLEVAVAIWGLESSFGAVKGSSDVPRGLATLAYAGRRTALGEAELLAVFEILKRGEATRSDLVGSWAGAMGHTQFMPSSFLSRAVDGNGDGRRDIWNSPADALASTLNYLKEAGWRPGEPWGVEVRVPNGFDWSEANASPKTWTQWRALGLSVTGGAALSDGFEARLLAPAGAGGAAFLVGRNFDAIRDYNAADAYALSIGLMADRIAGRGQMPTRWPTDNPPLGRTGAREMQTLLNLMGHDIGTVDGQAGPRTRAALQAFQKSEGLLADGYPSATALASLRAVATRRGLLPVAAQASPKPQPEPAQTPAPPGAEAASGVPVRMFGPADKDMATPLRPTSVNSVED